MFTSTWGNPNAPKRVLMIHGLTSSSTVWHQIAPKFASQGYFVTAPDLLGHGQARRGSDYTIAALAQELLPLLTPAKGDDHPYDIVVGHSLGGVVAAALLPHLKSSRPVHVVLVDPALEMAPERHAVLLRNFVEKVTIVKSPEQLQQENPSWTLVEAIVKSTNQCLCDAATAVAIMEQNSPWTFSHLLLTIPDNVKLTVLAADPSMDDRCVTEEDLKPYPRVIAKTVWGASHYIQHDAPQVVVEVALEQSELKN